MGLELLDEEVDQRGMESPCLGGFAGDVSALFGVEGFGDAIQVQALFPDLLEEVCDKNGFRYTSSGDEACVLPMAKGACGVLGSAVVRKLPGEDVECWKAGNSCLARPLGGLYCFVELVAVECVGVPMVISLVPGFLGWWLR